MAFPQTLMGKHGWEKVTTTAQKHKLGTRMQIAEREFVYTSTGEAIVAGNLVMGKAGTAAHQVDLAVSAGSAGATTITLSGSLSITKDEYKDGWIIFNDEEEVLVGTFSSTWDDFFDFLGSRAELKEVE